MAKIHLGLDVGSTTVKLVALNSSYELIYSTYKRHYSDVRNSVQEVILDAYKRFKNEGVSIMVTGSGGAFCSQVARYTLYSRSCSLHYSY